MTWKCDVCGDNIHFTKKDNGKIVPTKCPLEVYKTVKSYFSPEFRFFPSRFPDIPLSNSMEDLQKLKSLVPRETVLNQCVKHLGNSLQVKSALVTGNLRTFYLHFVRFLIDFYDSNAVHYVEPNIIPNKNQFNYLWLTETLLKDCFFKSTNDSKFKSMSNLMNPSLVIYSLGTVDSYAMKNKGDILMELITSRISQGKSTWIVYSKALSECDEVKSSENLRLYLANGNLPKIRLDELEEDPEVFGTPLVAGRRGSGNRSAGIQKEDDPYNLM